MIYPSISKDCGDTEDIDLPKGRSRGDPDPLRGGLSAKNPDSPFSKVPRTFPIPVAKYSLFRGGMCRQISTPPSLEDANPAGSICWMNASF